MKGDHGIRVGPAPVVVIDSARDLPTRAGTTLPAAHRPSSLPDIRIFPQRASPSGTRLRVAIPGEPRAGRVVEAPRSGVGPLQQLADTLDRLSPMLLPATLPSRTATGRAGIDAIGRVAAEMARRRPT